MPHRITSAILIGLLACVVAGCFASPEESVTLAPTGEPAPERRPIIIDADMDASDFAAIMVLLRDPEVDVRAITITGTGLVHCQGGRFVTRYLLDEMGVPGIPFGCGREDGGRDARPFPDEWRTWSNNGYGLQITPRAESGVPRDAVDVLREAVEGSPSAPTIVTLGPLTNLEDAFAADATMPDRLAGIHAMLGTVDAPGNVFVDGNGAGDPYEWNAFADPSAVEAVFATDVPIDIVPLDATDDVPVPTDLPERLASDRAAAGADLMYELLVRGPGRITDDGQQLWDELAALALSDQDLVTWSDSDLLVGEGGRLTADVAGRPVRYATSADPAAVETALLAALRRGGPRTTPFELQGSIDVAWDGTTCIIATNEGGAPGVYTVRYDGPPGVASGVLIGGVRPPHPWSDLTEFVATVDLETTTTTPEWIVEGGGANDEQGTGEPVTTTADLEALTYGPVCVTGTWPDLVFTPGDPFTISD